MEASKQQKGMGFSIGEMETRLTRETCGDFGSVEAPSGWEQRP